MAPQVHVTPLSDGFTYVYEGSGAIAFIAKGTYPDFEYPHIELNSDRRGLAVGVLEGGNPRMPPIKLFFRVGAPSDFVDGQEHISAEMHKAAFDNRQGLIDALRFLSHSSQNEGFRQLTEQIQSILDKICALKIESPQSREPVAANGAEAFHAIDMERHVEERELAGGYKYFELSPRAIEYIARGTVDDPQYPYIEFTASWTAIALGELEDGDAGAIPFFIEIGSPRGDNFRQEDITVEMHRRLIEYRPRIFEALKEFRKMNFSQSTTDEILDAINAICALEIEGSTSAGPLEPKIVKSKSIVYDEAPMSPNWPPPVDTIPPPPVAPSAPSRGAPPVGR